MTANIRKRAATPVEYQFDLFEEETTESDSAVDYEARGKPIGEKYNEKIRAYSVSDESCVLADRCMTSLRQQSDQFLSVVDGRKTSTSVSTLYRRPEAVRMKAST